MKERGWGNKRCRGKRRVERSTTECVGNYKFVLQHSFDKMNMDQIDCFVYNPSNA